RCLRSARSRRGRRACGTRSTARPLPPSRLSTGHGTARPSRPPGSRIVFLRSWAHPRIGGDPVHFPCLASIRREGLLEMAGVRCDVRDDEPDENGAAVEVFPGVELAAAVLELADRRWRHRAAAAVREVEAPLAGLGVVEAEAQAFDATGGALHVELHEIRRAAPDLPNHGRSLVF